MGPAQQTQAALARAAGRSAVPRHGRACGIALPLPDGEFLESFTIVTTGPNRLMTEIGHHRSPVMLAEQDWDCWLGGDKQAAEQLIRPPPDDLMRAHKVSTRVNNPGYQGEDLLEEG
jgi:putative SOS response-associated peptidase YedK